MASSLIGLHALIGEVGIFLFIWAFIEMRNISPQKVDFVKRLVAFGTFLFFLSWILGGYYYVDVYGSEIKPVIKEGPRPWAHSIIMETKEHLFLFLPFISLASFFFIRRYRDILGTPKGADAQKAILILLGISIVIGILMIIFGYLVSAGFDSAVGGSL